MSVLVAALVRSILEAPLGRRWSIQGFGMLRLYLSPDQRIHVWSAEHRVADVSDVHDHPWHFRSDVIAGRMRNQRFREAGEGQPYFGATIQCGAGARLVEPPRPVRLQAGPIEVYGPGESYAQRAQELHRSDPEPGTVTIITRTLAGDPEHARVYWLGGEWVDAAPQPATDAEVLAICGLALERWAPVAIEKAALPPAAVGLLKTMWLHDNYRLDYRSNWAACLDALDALAPALGKRVRDEEDLVAILKGIGALDDQIAPIHPRPAYLSHATGYDGSPALETTTCPAGDDEFEERR